MKETATARSKSPALPSSPPEGYLSVAQAVARGHLNEDQLRRYIKLGHLPVLIIEPTPGPQYGPGRKTRVWISPDAFAELERKTAPKDAPKKERYRSSLAATAPKQKGQAAAAQKVRGGDVPRG